MLGLLLQLGLPEGVPLLQLLSRTLFVLLLPCKLLCLTLQPLLVQVLVNHHNNPTVCNIPVRQLLCVILSDVFHTTTAFTAAIYSTCSRLQQLQLHVVGCQLEQAAAQQPQRCYSHRFGELFLDAFAATLQHELTRCAAEAAPLLPADLVGWSHSTAAVKVCEGTPVSQNKQQGVKHFRLLSARYQQRTTNKGQKVVVGWLGCI